LQVTVRFAGNVDGRGGDVVLDVECADGSTARVVLRGDVNSEATLPEPLGFLAPTRCTVKAPQAPTAKGASVAVTATVDPAPGGSLLTIPGVVEIGGKGTTDDAQEYNVVVTATFDSSATAPTQQKVLDTVRVLPVALIGAGLVGIGLLILLIMVLRSRAD
jgi:hypothetical protein